MHQQSPEVTNGGESQQPVVDVCVTFDKSPHVVLEIRPDAQMSGQMNQPLHMVSLMS